MIPITRKQQQNKLVLALRNKDAYPHKVYLPKIKIYETHISWIFLTELYAYKIKKEVKFGKILDFSTLYLRRKFCRKEIQVNKVLCGDMYKGIVKLVSRNNGTIKIVDLQTRGKPLEYAVKMLEIPQKFRMDYLIKLDKVSLKTIDRLTRIVVKFHSSTRTKYINQIESGIHPSVLTHVSMEALLLLSVINLRESTLLLLAITSHVPFYLCIIQRDLQGL
jgi:aminoglycoside phosphotransferase family enzyme